MSEQKREFETMDDAMKHFNQLRESIISDYRNEMKDLQGRFYQQLEDLEQARFEALVRLATP